MSIDLRADWPYLEHIAAERDVACRTRYHVDDWEHTEILGAAGELAARRFLGLSEQLHVGLDGGCDFEWRGWKADVKATVWKEGLEHRFLQWPQTKPVAADIIIMTGVDLELRKGIVIGFALNKDVMDAPTNQNRKYPCREIPITSLKPAWMLETIPFGRYVNMSRYYIFT